MLWLGLVGILLFLAFVIQILIQQNELMRDRDRVNRLLRLEVPGYDTPEIGERVKSAA